MATNITQHAKSSIFTVQMKLYTVENFIKDILVMFKIQD